jgi:hypothetical protein
MILLDLRSMDILDGEESPLGLPLPGEISLLLCL